MNYVGRLSTGSLQTTILLGAFFLFYLFSHSLQNIFVFAFRTLKKLMIKNLETIKGVITITDIVVVYIGRG